MSRVAQRYFDVLAAQDDLDAQEGALASVNRQLEQAEKRYEVGLIAVTDVQEARASHDSTAAAVIAAKRQVASAQEFLREITEDLFDTLARPIELPFEELTNPDPISEDRWVEMALQQNLSLVSSRLAAEHRKENVSSARGGTFPVASTSSASGYQDQLSDGTSINSDGTPYGNSSVDQYQRSIGIQLTFPLYSQACNGVLSQVRQAVYQHRAAKKGSGWSASHVKPNTTLAIRIWACFPRFHG